MKEIGEMDFMMVRENILMELDRYMREISKIMSHLEKVKQFTKMAQFMKETI